MNKMNCKTIELTKGTINLYDFGAVKLHAYRTNDPLSNEVFLFEKDGKMVILELPCFTDNIDEVTRYIAQTGAAPAGKLAAYHMAGASFLPDVPVYTTQNAQDYGHTGGGKALIENFHSAFGAAFDASIVKPAKIIEQGALTLAGIGFEIQLTAEAFDVRIPQINAVYTHMLGNDCHSIVAGSGHADAMIDQLNGYLSAGYDLVLSSHYTPEDLKDVRTKIAYLEELKSVAAASGSADAFKAAVKERYPAYDGANYLDMTAGFFFPEA